MQTPTRPSPPEERPDDIAPNGRGISIEPKNAETTAFDNGGAPQKKRSIAIPAIIAVAVLLGVGLFLKNRSNKTAESARTAAAAQAGPKLTTVRITPASIGTVVETIPLTGQLKSNQDVNINSKISGQVERVYINEGQRVTQGQLLVQLDTSDLQQQINSAQANLEAQQVKLQQAKVGLPASVAQINNAVREAQAQVNSAQARYQQAVLSEPTKTTNARSQVQSARAAVSSNQARVKQARDTLKQVQGQVNAGVGSARASLSQAIAQLDQVKNGSRAQQIAQAQAQVALAKAQRDNAQTNLNRQQQLYQGGATALANVQTAQTALEVAQAQLESAQQQLSLVQAGSRTEEVRAAEQVVAQREAALRQAQADLSRIPATQAQISDALGGLAQSQEAVRQANANLSQIGTAQQDVVAAQSALNQAKAQLQTAIANRAQIPVAQANVPAAQAAVDNSKAQLQQAQLNFQYASIKAPVAGVVNTKSIDAGETVTPGTTLLNVVSTTNVIFEAQVPASQLGQVKVGQPARVTVGSVGAAPLTGSVTDIIPVADARLRQFRVRISLPDDGRLTPGAFAQGILQTQVSQNALTVPTQDVRTDADQPYVYVALAEGDGAVVKKRTIKIGAQANGRTQVLGGLSDGDRVIEGNGIYEDNQKIKVAKQGSL